MPDLSRGQILVTGGAGLIGSAVIWELNRRGFEDILVSDHLRSSEKWRNLVPLRFRDYIEGDRLLERRCTPFARWNHFSPRRLLVNN